MGNFSGYKAQYVLILTPIFKFHLLGNLISYISMANVKVAKQNPARKQISPKLKQPSFTLHCTGKIDKSNSSIPNPFMSLSFLTVPNSFCSITCNHSPLATVVFTYCQLWSKKPVALIAFAPSLGISAVKMR